MPTYVCWSRVGKLANDQRERIATAITDIHHEVARAPRYFVQVIFNDLEPGSHFVGGRETSPDHIWVRADIRAGRSQEKKEQLLTRIAREVSEVTGSSREDIWVYISEIPGPSILEFGQVLPLPARRTNGLESSPLNCRRACARSHKSPLLIA